MTLIDSVVAIDERYLNEHVPVSLYPLVQHNDKLLLLLQNYVADTKRSVRRQVFY